MLSAIDDDVTSGGGQERCRAKINEPRTRRKTKRGRNKAMGAERMSSARKTILLLSLIVNVTIDVNYTG